MKEKSKGVRKKERKEGGIRRGRSGSKAAINWIKIEINKWKIK